MIQEPKGAEHLLARATLLALRAILPGHVSDSPVHFLVMPDLFPLSLQQVAGRLIEVPKPVSCHSFRLPMAIGIAYWSRTSQEKWLKDHRLQMTQNVDALRRTYNLNSDAKILVRGGSEALVLTLDEIEAWYWNYDFPFASRVATRADEDARRSGAGAIITFAPPDDGFMTTVRV